MGAYSLTSAMLPGRTCSGARRSQQNSLWISGAISPQARKDCVTHYSNHLVQHCGGLRCGDIDEKAGKQG